MRETARRNRPFDLRGGGGNIHASQNYERNGDERHHRDDDDQSEFHEVPGQLPFADGFVINSAVSLRQTIQSAVESVPARLPKLDRPVVLVGLMGAGKTRVGRRLAERLNLPFVDTDQVIEAENGRTIAQLFAQIGEPAFREGERRLIARLVTGPAAIVATGGGAFMEPRTRTTLSERAITVWLRADLDTLVARTSRSNKRPLLQGVDRAQKLAELMAARYPAYAEAHLTVDSLQGPVEQTVDAVLAALVQRCGE